VPEYLDPDCFVVVEGGVPETTAVLKEQFDYIFYTGNGTVGRIVMDAAAKHLTPVTLELGGKSPTLVDKDVDLDVAARRITWGKFFNAGQTCVAPDYILAHEAIESRLIDKLRATVKEFYGEDPKKSKDFARVVNSRHVQRLSKLLGSGDVVTGGDYDESQNYLAPTILRNVREDSPVMQDEIFGPILPVIKVQDMDSAIEFVNKRPKPLALYIFSNNREVQDRVIARTSSGGMSVNHAVVHLSVPGLPFGGVGPSGMGAYHGKASFDTFSHKKSVLRKGFALDAPILYPPYTESKQKWLKKLL
jgi:acyl-CoA reductase-like NAD-dependent aldehyde dehydrogenase